MASALNYASSNPPSGQRLRSRIQPNSIRQIEKSISEKRGDSIGTFMRDLSELNINEGGEKVTTPPPSEEIIQEFESHFGVRLPSAYISLLKFSNGGYPEADAFNYWEGEGGSNINGFFNLTTDRDYREGLWYNTEFLREILNDSDTVAIGINGGGDYIFLKLGSAEEIVYIFYREEGDFARKLADSFEEFIDGLYIAPDYI